MRAALNSSQIEKLRADRGLLGYCPKIVYVLSGGAPNALCHLGMIDALEKNGITPDVIVGTSAGSLLGALYSHFGNVEDVRGRIQSVFASAECMALEKKYFGEKRLLDGHVQRGVRHFFASISDALQNNSRSGVSFFPLAMISEKDAASLYARLFEGITFETLKVPFAAVAVDLTAGVPVVLSSRIANGMKGLPRLIEGPTGLMKAVMASSAIPLLFPAVQLDGHLHVDGGLMTNLPMREARGLFPGQELFLAGFDVSAPIVRPDETPSAVDLILQLLDPATRSTHAADRKLADVMFQPANSGDATSPLKEYERHIDFGRSAMTEDRLEACESIYARKCLTNIRKEKNALRRMHASSRLRQFAQA